MCEVKMESSESIHVSIKQETFEAPSQAVDPGESPGISALVSRLNYASSGSEATSRAGSDTESGGMEERRQEKNFPWLAGFTKQCRAAIGKKSVKELDNLLTLYITHVTPHFRDCHKLPNKAAKLKRNINDTMLFFHMLYMDIREPLENGFYHDKMTELMAMYLDLEITASRRGKDTEKTVTNKLSTSLYTFLDYSEDHILDALLRTKLINKHSKKVCVPLLRKILSDIVVRRPLSELTYVRFLLSFKLWKAVVADVEERRAINKLAAQRLNPPPEFFQEHDISRPSAEILPRVPKSKKNCTLFYVQAKFSLKDACKAFFRYCKENVRSSGYRRNMAGSEDMDKPCLFPSRPTAEDIIEAEEGNNLINDIWSAVSNEDCGSGLFSDSDLFGDIRVEDGGLDKDTVKRKKKKQDGPVSVVEVTLDIADRTRRKEKRKENNSVPDDKFVISDNGCVPESILAASPAKRVQDCCLGSVLLLEQVNEVGGGQGHAQADPCESELPTSSRQHSVLESLAYVTPGSDNEAVATSTVSPDASSVPPTHLDTNECDSSVEILQSRQGPMDVQCALPIELKSDLNIDEDLRVGKVGKADLPLELFSESDPAADDGDGCFGSPFSDYPNMFRHNDDVLLCRNAFGELEQGSMMRTDVPGSLPFQGNPLLEDDEDEYARGCRWSSAAEFHPSVQSTIINQSSGTPADLVQCFTAADAEKEKQDEREEPKLGQDSKQGKGISPGMLWHTINYGGKMYRVPAHVYARIRATYAAHAAQSYSQHVAAAVPQVPNPSNPIAIDAADNLKILAEEAVRMREASVAEAKCKSELAANCNLPLKKRKAMTQISDPEPKSNGEGTPSYSSAPMMSIAQLQGSQPVISKGVIVLNSQYGWQSAQVAGQSQYTPPSTPMKENCATVTNVTDQRNGHVSPVELVDHKPLDMSGVRGKALPSNMVKKTTSPPYPQHGSSSSGKKEGSCVIVSSIVQCSVCKNKGCDGKCRMMSSNSSVHERLVKCAICKVEGCKGRCKENKILSILSSAPKAIKCSVCKIAGCSGKCRNNYKNSEHKSQEMTGIKCSVCKSCGCNGCSRTYNDSKSAQSQLPEEKCVRCKQQNCRGPCKICVPSLNANTSARKGTPHDTPQKAVLKCFQCKTVGCSGKCLISHTGCSNSNSRKVPGVVQCSLCGTAGCGGRCKAPASTCMFCYSMNCGGMCRLPGRSTNNSLASVSDLDFCTFADKRARCNQCKNAGSCKCKTPSASCSNHTINSILGSDPKLGAQVNFNSGNPNSRKRGRAPATSRRTRSSASQTRGSASQARNSVSQPSSSIPVEDAKRRKKSLAR